MIIIDPKVACFCWLILFSIIISFQTANAANVYVNVSSTKLPLGTQSNPCKTLACGLRRSKDGDVIYVAPGIYTGPNNCNLCNATNCPSNFTMIGTGSPSEVIVSAFNISSGRAFSLYNAVFVKIINFSFRNFYLMQHLAYNEQLLTNTIPNGGGAITATQSNLFFSNVVFYNNSAAEGGALRAINCNVSIDGSQFVNNVGGLYGGALLMETSNLAVVDSTFSGNVAQGSTDLNIDGSGGALYAVGGGQTTFTLDRNKFYNNSAGQSGGAMYIRSTTSLEEDVVVVSVTYSEFVGNAIHGNGNCLTIASCDAGGGAVYFDVPTVTIFGTNFTNNLAATFASNSFAEGGALFLTSKVANLFTVADISHCVFTDNVAQSFGGGIYAVNQRLKTVDCQFTANVAGLASSLFADSAAAGGAIWYSSQESTSDIDSCVFDGNIAFGGWGGAVFITNALPQINILHSVFLSNIAFSSYTFSSQGGAMMLSHESQANITDSKFINNTAATFTTLVPNTFSGSGGAVFAETTILYMRGCVLLANKAVSGQFDDGANGGGLLLENVAVAEIEDVLFEYNSAEGYDGYSSYASSGSGGAISFKFATAALRYCHFYGNWVSVGGTHMSAGGAIAVYFAYTPSTTYDIVVTPLIIYNCTFVANVAYSQLCRSAAVKAGQGGAIAVIGASQPGINIAKSIFKENFAVATRTGFVPSVGGAITVSLVSNVTCDECIFLNNLAAFGIGNDVASFTGQNDGTAYGNRISFTGTRFTALVLVDVKQYIIKLLNASQTLCTLSKELQQIIDGKLHSQLAAEDMMVTGGRLQSTDSTQRVSNSEQLREFLARSSEASVQHNWLLKKFVAQERNVQLKQQDHTSTGGHPAHSKAPTAAIRYKGRSLGQIDSELGLVEHHLSAETPSNPSAESLDPEEDQKKTKLLRKYAADLVAEADHMRTVFEQQSSARRRARKLSGVMGDEASADEQLEISDDEKELGGWRDEAVEQDETDLEEDATVANESAFEQEHREIRRQLRQKLKFLKTNYANTPSVVITSGACIFNKPEFSAFYHVYVGDFVLMKNLFSSAETITPSSATLPLLRTSQLPTVVEINSVDLQQTLVLSVMKAEVQLSKTFTSALDLHRIRMFNATMLTSVDLTISGNCTMIDSYIVGRSNSTLIAPTVAMPLIRFTGNVHTGLGIQRSADQVPDVVFDDDIFRPEGSDDDIVERAKYYLATVPLMAVEGCVFQIEGHLRLTGDWVNTLSSSPIIHVRLNKGAQLHIMHNATLEINTGVYIEADAPSMAALINDGTIWLNPLVYTTGSTSISQLTLGEVTKPSQYSSAYSSLTVNGLLQQTPIGLTVLTVDPTHTNVPFLTLSTNYTYSGKVQVHLANKTTVALPSYGAAYPSNWTLISFGRLNASEVKAGIISTDALPAVINTIPGLLFRTQYFNLTANLKGQPSSPSAFNPPHEPVSETIVVTNLACADIKNFYQGVSAASTNSYCSVCSMNSSCDFCGGTNCVDKGTCATTVWSDCCDGGSCGAYGTCTSDFTCEYDCDLMFRESAGCDTLSTAGTIVIFCIAFVFCFAIVALLYYRYYKEQKSEILEELRQNLLQPAALINSRANGKKSSVPQQFLEDLQQSLILKDVFVNYEDIKIDSRIGEGSFGVVYKAYFRGAQVAVKQMRSPLFEDITQHDIEEFRKEAYMMSRLRHPNIVLVMGISLVDIEPAPSGRNIRDRDRDRDREESEDEGGFGGKLKPRESTRTVCIITEYLEQGSLADILYGSTRLPAEVFTYELVLACALQAARGMLYLHSHSPPICHRDLKSSNLVVDDHWVVKVTDFGMSRIIPEKVQNKEMGIGEDDREGSSRDSFRDSFRSEGGVAGTGGSMHPAHPARERSTVVAMYAPGGLATGTQGAAAVGGPFKGQGMGSLEYAPGIYSTPATDADAHRSSDPVESVSRQSEAGNRYSSFHPEMTSNLGTTAWCAPELLTVTNTTRYSVKVDVYSFGMVLWELWEKKRPFDDLVSRFDITDAIRAGKRPPVSDSCPPAFRSIMQRCWQAEPARRPTFKYIERYLKEELARVRRQKHVNVQGASSAMAHSMSSSLGTSDYWGPQSAGRRGSGTTMRSSGYGYHDSMDSIDGRTTINILQRNSGESSPAAVAVNPLHGSEAGFGVESSNVAGGGSGSGGNSGATRSAAIPIVAPLLAPENRTPLVAFDRSFSYLTAGSNTSTSSPLEGSSFGEAPYSLMAPPTASQAGPGYGGGRGPGAWGPNSQRLPSTPSSARGPTTPSSSNLWRDKYVLRFSGWQASKPDAGLPPSLSTGPAGAVGSSTPVPGVSSGAAMGAGAGANIPPRVSHNPPAQQSQPSAPLESLDDGSDRSEMSGSLQESVGSFGNSYSFSPNAVIPQRHGMPASSYTIPNTGTSGLTEDQSPIAGSFDEHENAIFVMDHVTEATHTAAGAAGSSEEAGSGLASALRMAGAAVVDTLSGSNRSARTGASRARQQASSVEPIPVQVSGTGSGTLTCVPPNAGNVNSQ